MRIYPTLRKPRGFDGVVFYIALGSFLVGQHLVAFLIIKFKNVLSYVEILGGWVSVLDVGTKGLSVAEISFDSATLVTNHFDQ